MKRLCCVSITAVLLFCLAIGVGAEGLPVLIDNAGLLSAAETEALRGELERIGAEYAIDMVVLTVDSLDGMSATDYADNYYDHNGYGDDGVLLLVSMTEREWWISTAGSCIYSINADQIADQFLPYLSEGSYYDAFGTFALCCEKAVAMQMEQYGDSNEEFIYTPGYIAPAEERNNPIGICILIGVAVGLIIVLVMKGQLKSVRRQSDADGYVDAGGLNLTIQTDRFLYQNISRRLKPQNNAASGGTHTGSSGRGHGGGGGRF